MGWGCEVQSRALVARYQLWANIQKADEGASWRFVLEWFRRLVSNDGSKVTRLDSTRGSNVSIYIIFRFSFLQLLALSVWHQFSYVRARLKKKKKKLFLQQRKLKKGKKGRTTCFDQSLLPILLHSLSVQNKSKKERRRGRKILWPFLPSKTKRKKKEKTKKT